MIKKKYFDYINHGNENMTTQSNKLNIKTLNFKTRNNN